MKGNKLFSYISSIDFYKQSGGLNMYDFCFLNELNEENVIFIFHKEEQIEINIINPITKKCSYLLKDRYTERNLDEKFIALQYPELENSEFCFDCFFDSPKSVSILYEDFKGIFVIDCSHYKSVENFPISKLLNYISNNSSKEFKFIVLFDRIVEKNITDKFKSNVKIINLQIGLSYIEDWKSQVNENIYNSLMKEFRDNLNFRQLSICELDECIKELIQKGDYNKSFVESFVNKSQRNSRRIGF